MRTYWRPLATVGLGLGLAAVGCVAWLPLLLRSRRRRKVLAELATRKPIRLSTLYGADADGTELESAA